MASGRDSGAMSRICVIGASSSLRIGALVAAYVCQSAQVVLVVGDEPIATPEPPKLDLKALEQWVIPQVAYVPEVEREDYRDVPSHIPPDAFLRKARRRQYRHQSRS